jgi:hypothetical protein
MLSYELEDSLLTKIFLVLAEPLLIGREALLPFDQVAPRVQDSLVTHNHSVAMKLLRFIPVGDFPIRVMVPCQNHVSGFGYSHVAFESANVEVI